jgi:hypothetical protein
MIIPAMRGEQGFLAPCGTSFKGCSILGVVVIVGLLLTLAKLPLVYKLFQYVSQEGLKGVYEWLMALINRLWEGGGRV